MASVTISPIQPADAAPKGVVQSDGFGASSSNHKLHKQTTMTQTVYKKLGGREAMSAAVDIFYNKILADDRVNAFFTNVNMKVQRAKQMAFMCYAFGGADSWKGRNMYEAHKKLKLTEEHFGAIAEHFIATLQELNVPQDVIDEAVGVVMTVKPQVLGLVDPDGTVKPQGCPVAHN